MRGRELAGGDLAGWSRSGEWVGDTGDGRSPAQGARELGVELSEVEGTDTDGQISVDDVRRKGAS